MTENIYIKTGYQPVAPSNTPEDVDYTEVFSRIFPDAPDWFSMEELFETLINQYQEADFKDLDFRDPKLLEPLLLQMAEEACSGGEALTGTLRKQIAQEVDRLLDNANWSAVRDALSRIQTKGGGLGVEYLDPGQLAKLVAGMLTSPPFGTEAKEELEAWLALVKEMQEAFKNEPRLVIEQALLRYLAENPGTDILTLDSATCIAHLTRIFNAGKNAGKPRYKSLPPAKGPATDSGTGLNNLNNQFDSFGNGFTLRFQDKKEDPDPPKQNPPKIMTKEELLLQWSIIQSQLEESLAAENVTVADANREMQEKRFQEVVQKRLETITKSDVAKVWDVIQQAAGVALSTLGALVAWGLVIASFATGNVVAGMFLIAAACATTWMAVQSIVDASVKWSGNEEGFDIFGGTLAEILKACGVDEKTAEEIGMWVGLGVTITLALISMVGSLGGAGFWSSSAKTAGTVIKNIASLISGLCAIGSGVVKGVDAGIKTDLAITNADLIELKAMLEELAESREMEQELTAAILKKIFEAIRGQLADSMDNALDNIEQIINMNFNKA